MARSARSRTPSPTPGSPAGADDADNADNAVGSGHQPPREQRPGGLTTRIRATRQGAAVEAVLARAEGFRSAQDLHAELRRQGEAVGLTTVYRHLTTLADNGTVDMLQAGDGEAVYRLCGTAAHHHHVVCRQCGASVEVDGPEVEAWAEQVAARAGYTDVSHTLEVFGTCSACHAIDS
jgi:Fur family ferric uptake transcriptional regulator